MKKTKKKINEKSMLNAIKTTPKDPTIEVVANWKRDGYLCIPEFQREKVYYEKDMSGLVESIFMGIPIPTIFLCEEDDGRKVNVIDGQQRLNSFISYLNNEITLKGLRYLPDLNGKKYRDLSKDLQMKYANAVLHCVVIGEENRELKYEIFERLNQGKALNDQELRNCVYHGPFNNMIEDLSYNKLLCEIIGERGNRKEHQKVILQYFLLLANGCAIGTGKKELNNFMSIYKQAEEKVVANHKKMFIESLKIFKQVLGKEICCNNNGEVVKNIFLSLMVAISRYNPHDIMACKHKILRQELLKVLSSNAYKKTLEKTTSSKSNNMKRYDLIIKVFKKNIKINEKGNKRLFTQADKKKLWHKGYICSYCNNEILSIDDAEIDHKYAYSKGGMTDIKNAQLLHILCNRYKSNKKV